MLFRVWICSLVLGWSAPPDDDAPVLQRPGQAEPAPEPEPEPEPTKPAPESKPEPEPAPEPAPDPTPAPPPASTQPVEQRPSGVVPLGRAEPEPEPAPAPAPVVAPTTPPPPPPPPPTRVVDEDLEPPKGPGTAMIAVGSVMGAAGIAVMAAALASDRFAPQPWQRAVVVPISLGVLSAGAALFIIGAHRHVKTRRWEDRSALVPVLAPSREGVALGLSGRF